MIGLRIAHVVSSMRANAAASASLHLCRWLEEHGHETLVLSGGGNREEEAAACTGALIPYRSGGAGWLLTGRRKLVKQVVAWDPDVVHVHRLDGLALGLAIADRAHAAVVVSVHNVLDGDSAEELSDPRIGLVLVPNDCQRAHAIGRCGLDKERVGILPYGIRLEQFADCPPIGRPLTIGLAGNFTDDRAAFETVLQAMLRLGDEYPDLRGVFCGGAGDREAVQRDCLAAGLGDRVSVIQQEGRLGPLLAEMHVVAYGLERDGHPIAMLKAMAAGRALIAGGVGSVPDTLDDGRTALLVPARDAAAVAAAWRRLLEEDGLAARLGTAARQQVSERHDDDRIGAIAHEAYRTVIRGTVPAGPSTVTQYRRMTDS